MYKKYFSIFTFYYLISYLLVIISWRFNLKNYNLLVHSVSIVTFLIAIKNCSIDKLSKLNIKIILTSLFIIGILILLMSYTIPTYDLIRLLYLLIMYGSFWLAFRNKSIESNTIFICITMGGLVSIFLDHIGFKPIIPPYNVCCSPVSFFPNVESGIKVNIGPPGSNIHFTSIISGIGLILVFNSILKLGLSVKRILISILMSYLLVFSGSRAIYLSTTLAIAILILERILLSRSKKLFTLFAFTGLLSCLLAVYYSKPILNYLDSVFTNHKIEFLIKTNIDDPTSGRSLLWDLHLSIFEKYPLGGGGEDLRHYNSIHEKEFINGMARATHESYFTYLLAIYGLWSILIFLFYLFLFTKMCISKNTLKVSLLAFGIVATAASSLFGAAYGIGVWLLLPLISAKVKPS